MWERKQLKEKAKTSFKANYWKSVLVALVFALFAGGVTAATGFGEDSDSDGEAVTESYERERTSEDDGTVFKIIEKKERTSEDDGTIFGVRIIDEGFGELADALDDEDTKLAAGIGIGVFLVTFLIVFLVVFVLLALVYVLIGNPLEIGCDKFFFRNLGEPAQVKEVAFAFDHGYKNVVKIMFFRDLYTVLWTLLFIIPGIVKSYEYKMIPYLLAENPNLTKEEAFAESRRMMQGQKWRAFVLDLSFLGWGLLSVLTLGILHLFYVGPYKRAAQAALYEALCYGNGTPQAEDVFDGQQ